MKLVRDRIPELATSNGQPGAFHQATEADYGRLLRDKLLEEAAEAATAAPAELLAELGDVLQVLYALAADAGFAAADIECARARKARTRGAFTRRVVWHDLPSREDTCMSTDGIFIADLEDGCQAAAGWVDYFDHLTLPLTGQALADAQATLAAWDDPNSPQGGLGDCWGCVANVNRLRALVHQATQPASRADGPR
jgi:predicted house-cleaning noncanonical NTP pyrophosphatase (MazG superfamily)